MPNLYPELLIPIYGTTNIMSVVKFFASTGLIYLFATSQIDVSSINNNFLNYEILPKGKMC